MRTVVLAGMWIGGFLVGYGIGLGSSEKKMKEEAVRLGHAEYRADKDGNVVWVWREMMGK